MDARICNQDGIKFSGAIIVLENSAGKFIKSVNAKNSICPGKISPIVILIAATWNIIKHEMLIIIIKLLMCNINCVMHMLVMMTDIIWVRLIVAAYVNNEKIKAFLFINGEISNLLKNPNSLSNIMGNPVLIDDVKEVKIIRP